MMKRSLRLALLGLAAAAYGLCGASSHSVAQVLVTHRLPLALALEAAEASLASCARQGYAVVVVVVDADGVRQVVLRGDGTGAHSLDSATDKAYTAASYKSDTTALVERAAKEPIAAMFDKLPNLLLAGGGVAIKMGSELIGAIGVSGAPGSNLDDGCARAGLAQIQDRLK
jgi:uncharacterized protein GlcG (DUF336 family)